MTPVFEATLDMPLRASRLHKLLIVTLYTAGFVIAVALASQRVWLGALLPVIGYAGFVSYRRATLRRPHVIRWLRWHADGQWAWQTGDRAWHSGERVTHWVGGTTVVIVTLRPAATRWRRRRCVLFHDSLGPHTHRRLRARLTVAPLSGADEYGSAPAASGSKQ